MKVEKIRSAEQWVELADSTWDQIWCLKPTQKTVYDILGRRQRYTPTGSVFDGWKEYLLFTRCCCSPDVRPDVAEDVIFLGATDDTVDKERRRREAGAAKSIAAVRSILE